MANGNITSRVEGKTLILEYVFDAPRELVFKAFSDKEYLKHWWGPNGWELPVCNIDFRPGGTWHYCMRCEDKNSEAYGQESWGLGTYLEIDEPEKIVYIDVFADADGNVIEGMPKTKITNLFVEFEGKTKFISSAEYNTEEEVNTVIGMGVLEGVTQTWMRLAALLEQMKK